MFLKNCWYVGAWDHELIDAEQASASFATPASSAGWCE
jgi:hypothetical protein